MAFEKYFYVGSDPSDYITMLNSSSMKTSIQLSRDDLPNKLLMLNDDFRKYLPGQIVALISTIGRVDQ